MSIRPNFFFSVQMKNDKLRVLKQKFFSLLLFGVWQVHNISWGLFLNGFNYLGKREGGRDLIC